MIEAHRRIMIAAILNMAKDFQLGRKEESLLSQLEPMNHSMSYDLNAELLTKAEIKRKRKAEKRKG